MTDFSRLQTIEEVEHQIDRMQRRASIQQEKLDTYVRTVIQMVQTAKSIAEAVYTPFSNAFRQHSQTLKTVWDIVGTIFKRLRK